MLKYLRGAFGFILILIVFLFSAFAFLLAKPEEGAGGPLLVIKKAMKFLSLRGEGADKRCEKGLRGLLDEDLLETFDCYRGKPCYDLEVICGRVDDIRALSLNLRKAQGNLYIYYGAVDVVYWNEGKKVREIMRGKLALRYLKGKWYIYQVILDKEKLLKERKGRER